MRAVATTVTVHDARSQQPHGVLTLSPLAPSPASPQTIINALRDVLGDYVDMESLDEEKFQIGAWDGTVRHEHVNSNSNSSCRPPEREPLVVGWRLLRFGLPPRRG